MTAGRARVKHCGHRDRAMLSKLLRQAGRSNRSWMREKAMKARHVRDLNTGRLALVVLTTLLLLAAITAAPRVARLELSSTSLTGRTAQSPASIASSEGTDEWRDAGAGGPRAILVPQEQAAEANAWRDAGAGGPRAISLRKSRPTRPTSGAMPAPAARGGCSALLPAASQVRPDAACPSYPARHQAALYAVTYQLWGRPGASVGMTGIVHRP